MQDHGSSPLLCPRSMPREVTVRAVTCIVAAFASVPASPPLESRDLVSLILD